MLVFAGGSPGMPDAEAKKRCAKAAKKTGKGSAKHARCVQRSACQTRANSKAARRRARAMRGKQGAARRTRALKGRSGKCRPRRTTTRGAAPIESGTPTGAPGGQPPATSGGEPPAPDGRPTAPTDAEPPSVPDTDPPAATDGDPPATAESILPAPVRELHFAPTSVWDAPLPADAPIAPDSWARLDPMLDHVEARQADMFFPSISISSYSTPVYIVPLLQPRVPVILDAWNPSLKRALSEGVPIPPNARQAAGTDGHLTIYQPSTDSMWEFWKASKRDDGWHAAWGGAMRHVSTRAGYYNNNVWPGLSGLQGYNWGSTATSLPVAGGLITIQDLREGRIDHALAASVPFACQDFFLFPAQRTDGLSTRSDCIPEGARLRLDPNLDVSALNVPPVTKLIARAAQKYGIIVRDKTGGQSISLFAEQVQYGQPNVYAGPDGLLDGYPAWSLLGKFPWRKLKLMRAPACTAAPCTPSS